jgi:hypothetical protein
MQNDALIKVVINDIPEPRGSVHTTSDNATLMGGGGFHVKYRYVHKCGPSEDERSSC